MFGICILITQSSCDVDGYKTQVVEVHHEWSVNPQLNLIMRCEHLGKGSLEKDCHCFISTKESHFMTATSYCWDRCHHRQKQYFPYTQKIALHNKNSHAFDCTVTHSFTTSQCHTTIISIRVTAILVPCLKFHKQIFPMLVSMPLKFPGILH